MSENQIPLGEIASHFEKETKKLASTVDDLWVNGALEKLQKELSFSLKRLEDEILAMQKKRND